MFRPLIGLLLLSFSSFAKEHNCSAFYPEASQEKSCDYHIIAHYRQLENRPQDFLADYVLIEGFAIRLKEKAELLLGKKETSAYLRFSLFDKKNKEDSLGLLGLPPNEEPIYVDKVVDFDNEKLATQIESSDLDDEKKLLLANSPNLVFLEGKKNPLKVKGLIKMFVQVINEERLVAQNSCTSMEPRLGLEPKWATGSSPITNGPYRSIYKTWSKLLIALAMGETNSFMFVGRESELREWILSQGERSVNFENVFRKSYQLNCANVSDSILMVLNVLSEHFRYPSRELLAQTTKLSPIINHLGNGQDTYGPWYHFFGLLIYGYHHGTFTGKIHATIEKGTSLFSKDIDEKQENYMSAALKVGKQLNKIISKKSYLQLPNDPESLERENYLNLTEEFTKRINKAYK